MNPQQLAAEAANKFFKEWMPDCTQECWQALQYLFQTAIEKAYQEGYTHGRHYWLKSEPELCASQASGILDDLTESKDKALGGKPAQASERCSGPRQHGHPLVYESHCDHGETKPHLIKPAQASEMKT